MSDPVRNPLVELVARPIVTGLGASASGPLLLRPQGLPDWLIWQTTTGQCRVETKTGWVMSGPGELILIAPRIRQHYGRVEGQTWTCVWAVFEPRAHWYEWLRWPELSRGIMRLIPPQTAVARAATATLRRVHDHATAGPPGGAAWAMNTLERLLLRCDRLNARQAANRLDPRVERAMHWLQGHIHQSVTAAECGRAVACSPVHLRRLFRAAIGCSPMSYHERCRIQRAMILLRLTGMTVSEIAAELGFNDPFYFSTRFRHHLGRSPTQYRATASWSHRPPAPRHEA